MQASLLSLTRDRSYLLFLTIIIAALAAICSLAGLFWQSLLYPTQALRDSFVANDLVNLLVALPALLGAAWLAWRGKWIGWLLMPGALLYVTYNYIAYAVAMPFTWQSLVYLALVTLSLCAVFFLYTDINAEQVKQQLEHAVAERVGGCVLIGFSLLFLLRAVGQLVTASGAQNAFVVSELAVPIADVLIMPFWLAGGILLWRRRARGYVMGGGLLFQASLLFIALLVLFLVQPFVSKLAFPMMDFIVIFAMGLVCWLPFGFFVRGVLQKGKST